MTSTEDLSIHTLGHFVPMNSGLLSGEAKDLATRACHFDTYTSQSRSDHLKCIRHAQAAICEELAALSPAHWEEYRKLFTAYLERGDSLVKARQIAYGIAMAGMAEYEAKLLQDEVADHAAYVRRVLALIEQTINHLSLHEVLTAELAQRVERTEYVRYVVDHLHRWVYDEAIREARMTDKSMTLKTYASLRRCHNDHPAF